MTLGSFAAVTSPLLPPNREPFRLGVYPVTSGLNIAVWAPHAEGIEFCVFVDGSENRWRLNGPINGIWHGFLADHSAGTQYGFRAYGPWSPQSGHRYNPANLLLDPYGRGLTGSLPDSQTAAGQRLFAAGSAQDSAPVMPKSVVTHLPAAPMRHPQPRIPLVDSVLYEIHVKGFTKNLAAVPADLRGTYAGLAHPATIAYLHELGVTTIELLPVQAHASEPHLEELGLTNYWGYSTLSYFTPHPDYATAAAQAAGPQAIQDEFRGMVDLLHAAGLEVVLDVVYNHTCEAGLDGRTVCWRGLDNQRYYRHLAHAPQEYDDTTGTGNTLNFADPGVMQMALDSLRYWATEMGVDGFRFDLAVSLGRTQSGFRTDHPFLVAAATDPDLRGLKLIAEPWDVGLGGWQVGNFPPPFAEWNDRFRDFTRDFWLRYGAAAPDKAHRAGLAELATRLAGSSDLFGQANPYGLRGPIASINFITAHDGFTLWDLVSYNDKHNSANGEDNRDGTPNNRSFNHGVEGETQDPDVLAARQQSARNLLATLFLAAGTPMLLGGDEFGRSQAGNNNAYCQDNHLSYFNWDRNEWQLDLFNHVKHLISLRKSHPVLRSERFFDGSDRVPWDNLPRTDSAWFTATGEIPDESWWQNPHHRVLQFMRSLSAPNLADALVIINGGATAEAVTIPGDNGRPWFRRWDSSVAEFGTWDGTQPISPGQVLQIPPLSVQLLLSAQAD